MDHTFFDKQRQDTPETQTRPRTSPSTNNTNTTSQYSHSTEINARLAEAERRLAMFETMFHALSGKLDHHFKRYDMIIQSQQQQVNALNSIVSTLLNDQVTNAEIIRDKLSHNVNDISSQSSIITGMSHFNPPPPQHHSQFQPQPQQQQQHLNRTSNLMFVQADTDELLEDILNNDTPTTTSDDHANSNSISHSHSKSTNSIAPTRSQSSSGVMNMDPKPPVFVKETYDPNNDSTEKSTVHIQYPPISEYPSNETFHGNGHIPQSQSHPKYTHSNIPQITDFKFIKWPHSVREIWLEYVEGVKGQPSIKDMEALYQSSWRREASVTKRYSRRKVLCKAIENGLSKGYDLENIINILENHRIIDHENGIKQPIGWLCRPANIPQVFK